MSTTAENLQSIINSKEKIRLAINTKGVTVTTGATLDSYASAITGITTGGGALTTGYTVRFIDYDGTILKEELVASGASATAPTVQDPTYLTFNSWNNTFTGVTSDIDVGAIYNTTNGKSYLFITLDTTGTTGLSPRLCIYKETTGLATIDWGDGTTSTGVTDQYAYFDHTYSTGGDYIITITNIGNYYIGINSEANSILSNGTYRNTLKKIYYGSNIPQILSYSFSNYINLQNIVISTSVTSIGNYVFNYCYELDCLNIPLSVTTLGLNCINNCYTLKYIVLNRTLINVNDNMINYCHNLKKIVIPPNITSTGKYNLLSYNNSLKTIIFTSKSNTYNNFLLNCYSIDNITLLSGTTKIASGMFQNCYNLNNINIPSTVTSIDAYSFSYNQNLSSVIMPSGVTIIGQNAFEFCTYLESINIPTGVTTINQRTFQYCHSLKSLNVPSSVTTLSYEDFKNCYNLKDYIFNSTTPPTLGSTNVFTGINLLTKIYVPDASVDAYKGATNWSTYAKYIFPLSTRP